MSSKYPASGNLIRLFPRATYREQGPPESDGGVDDSVVIAHLRQLELRGQTSDSRDLLLVQGLLGHAQPSTTAGYARWDQGAAADVVSRIPAPGHLRVVSE